MLMLALVRTPDQHDQAGISWSPAQAIPQIWPPGSGITGVRHHSQSKSTEILPNIKLQKLFISYKNFLQSNRFSTTSYFVTRDMRVWFIFFIWVLASYCWRFWFANSYARWSYLIFNQPPGCFCLAKLEPSSGRQWDNPRPESTLSPQSEPVYVNLLRSPGIGSQPAWRAVTTTLFIVPALEAA